MSAPIKSLLRGLRFMTQAFDSKEPEMEIGLPTDVKHVSHIGLEGASANQPSWMSTFKPGDVAKEPSNSIVQSKNLEKNLTPEEKQDSKEKPKKKSRRKPSSGSSGSLLSSPKSGALDSPRRGQSSNLSNESSSQDPAGISKQSRRKKSKQQSGGSESGQKTKNRNSK
ncbi:CRIB domain-containing protein RIC5-like [Mangifera indica]|uniref:CRIB domain-containing protein RIC5-like n=1 Tax=Mangifera indica TaxID=29780 RepID=UPI001CF95D10|nr:CRIB domain-containing protein RIC5-like [Mangifera indica]